MAEEDGDKKDYHKLVLSGLGVLLLVVLAGLHLGYGPRWYQGYQPDQPIPFSHLQHAGQYKIPCLYCHSQAEYAATASVPGLETCMNCHTSVLPESPWIQKMTEAYQQGEAIAWVKVNVLPDFVQFKHDRHIEAGVTCQECHGPVQEMEKVYQWAPLSMGWCVDCHRNNNYVSAERAEVLNRGLEIRSEPLPPFNDILGHPPIHNADISCSTCHY